MKRKPSYQILVTETTDLAKDLSIIFQLKAAGLPGDLLCDGGSIDGPLYSFLSTSGEVSVSSRKNASCANYDDLYHSVDTLFSNPDADEFTALGKSLVDELYTERKAECDGVLRNFLKKNTRYFTNTCYYLGK